MPGYAGAKVKGDGDHIWSRLLQLWVHEAYSDLVSTVGGRGQAWYFIYNAPWAWRVVWVTSCWSLHNDLGRGCVRRQKQGVYNFMVATKDVGLKEVVESIWIALIFILGLSTGRGFATQGREVVTVWRHSRRMCTCGLNVCTRRKWCLAMAEREIRPKFLKSGGAKSVLKILEATLWVLALQS